MKNKLFWILTGVLLFILATTAIVSADTIVTGPNYITGTNVYWHIMRIDATSETRLTVAGSGGVPSYESQADTPWASYASDITEIKIENGITSLGQSCFRAMRNLYSADLGDTVQDILPNSFANCTALKYVYLPRDLYTLYEHAFYNCQSLTNMTLPSSNGFYKIENGIMTDSDGKYIYWGGGITGDEYYIPSTVTNIAGSAFSVPMTTKIYVPDTVTGIATEAIRSDHVVCGVSGSVIEEYMTDPFVGGSLAETYDGMCGPTVFWKRYVRSSLQGITASVTIKGEGKTNGYTEASPAPWGQLVDRVTVDGNITSLGAYLFRDCTNLTSVSLPSTIKTINSYCFYGCTSLTSIEIPTSATSIGASAFANCTSLATVSLPNTLQYIYSDAFKNTALTTIDIPASVYTIYSSAFLNCTKLESINVSASDTKRSSENGVLFDKNKTTLQIYPAGKTDATYYVPNTVTTITSECYGSANLKKVYIPKTVTLISEGAFSACEGLTIYGYTGSSADIYATNNSINFEALDGTFSTDGTWSYDLIEKTLDISIQGIIRDFREVENVPWAYWLPEIETVYFNEGITSIGQWSMATAVNLKYIYLPTTLEIIYPTAFNQIEAVSAVYYAGSIDEYYDNIYIYPVGNQAIIRAEINYGKIRKINSVAVSGTTIFVSTENIEDGKTIMVAAYDGNKFIEYKNVTINNNMGSLPNVSTDGWSRVKAFMINLETLIPAANTAEFEIK